MMNTETKKLTAAKVRQQQKEAQNSSVCEMLQWSELAFGAFVFEQGIAYLNAFIPEMHAEGDNPEKGKATKDFWISAMIRTQSFWKWWKNHWSNRDELFFDSIDFSLGRRTIESMYKELHNGTTLGEAITPHGIILETMYSEMVELIRKEAEAERIDN